MDQERVNAVQRMQDYIGAHLAEPITLRLLADAAGYSPFHAARAFKELIGDPPVEYIRKLRLTQAALRLRDSDERVLDVALDYLFGSQEGFTRAFHRAFGLPPARYRRETPPIGLYTAYPARSRYELEHPHEGREIALGMSTQRMRMPARTLLYRPGKTAEGYFEYCEEAGCDVWGVLCSVKEALGEPMGLWLPDCLRAAGTSRYVQGVDVPAGYAGVVPPGFALLDLPACDMLLFQSDPFPDEDYGAAIAGLWASVAAYDPSTDGLCWATDEQPRFQLEPQGWRGYLEGRPVRPLKDAEAR